MYVCIMRPRMQWPPCRRDGVDRHLGFFRCNPRHLQPLLEDLQPLLEEYQPLLVDCQPLLWSGG